MTTLDLRAPPPVDPFRYAADILDPPTHPFATDIGGWVDDALDEHMTEAQRGIADSVVGNRYTAVRASHSVGKSFTAARIAAWWIETHPPGEALVITTAPTWKQVRAVLWHEIARAHRRGKIKGRITEACEWKLGMGTGPDELVGLGLKPADYDPSGFQGLHRRYVLVIIDEAGGVPKPIYDAADSLVTNEDCRMLAIGNPDDPSAHFAAVCKPGSGWNVLHIDALRSPNFTREAVAEFPKLRSLMIREGIRPSAEEVPTRIRPLLVSPQWVSERIDRWGIDSPLFKSKVRGVFPEITLDTLIQPGWVLAAQIREMPVEPTDPRIGVDVARYGSDHSIIGMRQGGHYRMLHDIPYGPVTALAGQVALVAREFRTSTPIINVDDTGVGGGLTDILLEEGFRVLPLIAGSTGLEKLPNGRPRFTNARAEWAWTVREALAGPSGTGEDGWIDLDPEDDDLAAQLLRLRYGVNRHGQIWVESKDEMRKRGFGSPDRADTFVYTLVSEVPTAVVQPDQSYTADLMESDAW